VGSCCICKAIDSKVIKKQASHVGLNSDDFMPIGATVVVCPDPV